MTAIIFNLYNCFSFYTENYITQSKVKNYQTSSTSKWCRQKVKIIITNINDITCYNLKLHTQRYFL